MTTKQDITTAKVTAMKAKDSFRSNTLGNILAAIKQVEVDTRTVVEGEGIINVLNRMVKQRQESITQFVAAARTDLAEVEQKELEIIKEFLPTQATGEEIEAVIEKAINAIKVDAEALTPRAIGHVMALVKADLNGKADMAKVAQQVKAKLA